MRRSIGFASVLIVLGGLLPGMADARPRVAKVVDVNDVPGQITRGPGKTFWAPLGNNELARVKGNGAVTHFSPGDLNFPEGLTMGRDGNLWATQNMEVVRIPPGDPDSAEDFPAAAIGDPRRIVNGPNGRLWTASGDKLISFKPNDPVGTLTQRTIDGMAARGIAAANGKLWIADFGGERIVRVNPDGGFKRFKTGGGPQEVARGARGRIAFTNQGASPHKVGRIEGKRARQFAVPDTDPFGITFAAKRWWIANFTSRKLTVLSQSGKPRKRVRLPANAGARWIAAGARGTLGVSLETAKKIALIRGL